MVHLEQVQCVMGQRSADRPVGMDARVVAHPAQQPVGDPRCAAGAAGDLRYPALVHWDGQQDCRSADDLGQTIVMVTHDAHAAAIADRIVFLQDGLIVKDCDRMSRDEIFDTIKELEAPR